MLNAKFNLQTTFHTSSKINDFDKTSTEWKKKYLCSLKFVSVRYKSFQSIAIRTTVTTFGQLKSQIKYSDAFY